RFRDADPDFPKLLEALRTIQRSESLHTEIERHGPDEDTLVVLRGNVPPEIADEIAFVRKTLGLRSGLNEISLVLGMLPRADAELAVMTRSMLDILIEISTTIEVPPKDVEEKRTIATRAIPDSPTSPEPLIRVHYSNDRPVDAFTAVQYRSHWFWIDDR